MVERIKKKLAGGEMVTMVLVNHSSPSLVERIGRMGFDIAFIDCEKGSASFAQVDEMCRAARAARIAAVVRPWTNEPGLISRYLDIGADGIVAAGIEEPEGARSLVEAVRYARFADFENKLVIPVLESPTALAGLPALLAVEGVDCWFIGPNDLAHRMGFPGGGRRDEVRAEVRRSLSAIRQAGHCAGTVCGTDDVSELVEAGAQLLLTRINDLLAEASAAFHTRVSTSAQRAEKKA